MAEVILYVDEPTNKLGRKERHNKGGEAVENNPEIETKDTANG